MTVMDFVKLIDAAAKRTEEWENGYFTCNSIKFNECNSDGKDGWMNSGYRVADKYAWFFGVTNCPVDYKKPMKGATNKELKSVRLTMLEMFKQYCLETKEYEKF